MAKKADHSVLRLLQISQQHIESQLERVKHERELLCCSQEGFAIITGYSLPGKGCQRLLAAHAALKLAFLNLPRLWKEVVERRQQQPLQLALSMKDSLPNGLKRLLRSLEAHSADRC